jgi:predicted nucleic acid-binding protein
MRVYVDTNVFMDFLYNRNSAAYRFFVKTLSCMHTIVISDVVLEELSFQKVDSDSLMRLLSHKIEVIPTISEDKLRAKRLLTHYNDALHICIAERSKVDAIITRNKKDFAVAKISVKYADEI